MSLAAKRLFKNKKNQHHHFAIFPSKLNRYLDPLAKLFFLISDKTRFFSLLCLRKSSTLFEESGIFQSYITKDSVIF